MAGSGLTVREVSKSFGRTPVLCGVSLQAPPGRLTGLVGPNGAGKSTLFRILMGVLPAGEGGADIDGTEILGLPLHRKAAVGLGYLPQESASFPELTVEENLLAILEVLPLARAERPGRLSWLLSLTGLESVAGSPYGVLSGGERRRLEIAKALASRPRVLLMDEPFSGLDPKIIDGISVLLGSLKREGVAVLLTDHSVHVTLSHVDYAYLLTGGRIACEGPPAELRRDPRARESYFGDRFGDA